MTKPKYLTVKDLTSKELWRLFTKIELDKETGCWNWIAARSTYGYGEFWFRGGMEQAHRLMYAWHNGRIPKGVGKNIPVLDHIKCNNPRCCNPSHLRLTTTVGNLERTNSVSAVNRRKTHCKHGHLLPTKPNRANGIGRYCVICRKAQCHAAYLRRVASSFVRKRDR